MPETLSDEFLTAIGRVAVRYTELETMVDVAIGHALGCPDPYGIRALTTHIPSNVCLDIFMSTAGLELEWSAQARVELRELVDKLKQAASKRNKYVHGTWRPTEKPEVAKVTNFSARGEFRILTENVTVADITRFAEELSALKDAVYQFAARHHLFWG